MLSGLVVGAALPRGGASAAAGDPLAPVQQAYNLLLQDFAGKLDPSRLITGAIDGMMAAVGDPFTAYLPPAANATFSDALNGTDGIGVTIQALAGGYVIVSVLAGGPAQAAGLRSGDLIVSVGGHSVAGQDPAQVVALTDGPAGTTVTLGIRSPGAAGSNTVVLTRQNISAPTVLARTISPGVGMIQITEFSDTTGTEFDRALAGLRAQPGGLQGLILDLRGNPGGYVASALHIVDEIAPPGPVLRITDGQGHTTTYTAPAHAAFPPTVILVDGRTASAAEILAGTLQYTGSATLVGQKTYGKGSVQQLFSLPGGGAVKITVGYDQLPNGVSWELTGLTPNVLVPPAPSPASALPEFAAVGARTLRAGMIGLDVFGLQQRLQLLGYYDGIASGIYDALTAGAVQLFQHAAGLAVTGEMAPADWKALGTAVGARVQQIEAEPAPDTTLQRGLQVLQGLLARPGGGS